MRQVLLVSSSPRFYISLAYFGWLICREYITTIFSNTSTRVMLVFTLLMEVDMYHAFSVIVTVLSRYLRYLSSLRLRLLLIVSDSDIFNNWHVTVVIFLLGHLLWQSIVCDISMLDLQLKAKVVNEWLITNFLTISRGPGVFCMDNEICYGYD